MPLSLKSIFKGNSKHKKLSEEKSSIGQNADEGAAIAVGDDQTTFDVKYLGNTAVDSMVGAIAAEAVKTIMNANKASKKKPQNVTFTSSGQGIKVTDASDEHKTVLDTPIERVSHCFTDSTHNSVFAFVTVSGQTMMECHAFKCAKRATAQEMSKTISELISSIPEVLKEYNKQKPAETDQKTPEKVPHQNVPVRVVQEDVLHEVKEAKLIDLSGEPLPRQQYDTSRWVNFEDDSSSKLDMDLLHQRPEGFANFSHHFKQDRQMCC